MNNTSNQNRKLTPSKGNINIRGNQGISQNNMTHNFGRNYDQKPGKGKINGRSNTIEIMQEKDSRKNIKKKDRMGSSLDAENTGLNPIGTNTGGAVQVSEGGSLLIGPGGRPKTSSGKHTGGNLHPQGSAQMASGNQNNSRLSHYSAGQNTGNNTKTN